MSIELISAYISIPAFIIALIPFANSFMKRVKEKKLEYANELKNVNKEISQLMMLTTTATKRNDIAIYIQAIISDHRHMELKLSNELHALNIIFLILSIVALSQIIIMHMWTGEWSLILWVILAILTLGLYSLSKISKNLKDMANMTQVISNEFIASFEQHINKIQSRDTSIE